jgi:hypothetical protein
VRPASLPWRYPDDFAVLSSPAAAGLTLRFRTPTFIRRGDDPRGSLEFRDVVDDLLRRISLLSHAYGDDPVHPRHEELAMMDAAAGYRSRTRRCDGWTSRASRGISGRQ